MAKVKKRRGRRWYSLGSIRARVRMAFALLSILFLVILGISLVAFKLQLDATQRATQLFKPTELFAQKIITYTQQSYNLFQKWTFTSPKATAEDRKLIPVKIKRIWKDEILSSLNSLNKLIQTFEDEELSEKAEEIKKKILKLNTITQAAVQALSQAQAEYMLAPHERKEAPISNNPLELSFLFNPELARILNQQWESKQVEIQLDLQDLIDKCQIAERAYYFELQSRLFIIVIGGLGLIFVLLLAWFLGAYWVNRYIKKDIRKANEYIEKLTQGDVPPRVKYHSAEFKELDETFFQLSQNLNALQQFALQIGENQFNYQNVLFGDSGTLGSALAKMRDGLKNLAQENDIRYWTNNGIALFSEIITRNANSLEQLADEVISHLVSYLQINQGGFFIVAKEKNDKPYLELKASYAYDKKKYLEKRIELGQGLLGQTWLEGELMYLKEIPQNYVEITSGLGGATPKALLISPLKNNQEIFGVIELASFTEFEDYKIELIKKIAENVGQAIAASRTNEQTRKLLREAQELTSTLQAQDEQMRQNMEELQQTQEMMGLTQKELAEKEANLKALINNTSHAIIAFDKAYRITVVNKAMLQFYEEMGISLEIGKNLLEEIPSDDYRKNRWEYERVLSGEKFVITREIEINTRKFFYELNYNPILNEKQIVIGASIFMENITQQIQAENQLKEAQANLTSLINDTEDMIMALDKDYRLIVANEVCLEEFAKNGYTLQIGTSFLEYFPENTRFNWKSLYDRALGGERFVKVIETGKSPDKTYREYWFNPIRDEREQITGLSIFSRDITEAKTAENKIRQVLLESLESAENLKIREAEMQQKIMEYELKIRELEEKISVS